MKSTKTMLWVLLGGTFTFIAALFTYSTMKPLGTFEYVVAGMVFAVVVFSLILGYKRLTDEKNGLTVDDELSNLIKQKAAASSFLYPFYVWTLIIIFTFDSHLSVEVPIGIGIFGMALLFIGFWIYYSNKGISNEDSY